MFLEWNITAGNYSHQRLVTSSERRDIPSLRVDHTTFRFVRESREPLNITLFIINATVDWRVSCIEYPSSTQNALETTVHVIRTNHINSKFNHVLCQSSGTFKNFIHNIGYIDTSLGMIAVEPSFGEENVTLTVTLDGMQTMVDGLAYGVVFTSSFEEIIGVFSDGNDASIELTMLYNIEYNLSTFATLCGFENRSNVLNLLYGEFIMEYY